MLTQEQFSEILKSDIVRKDTKDPVKAYFEIKKDTDLEKKALEAFEKGEFLTTEQFLRELNATD